MSRSCASFSMVVHPPANEDDQRRLAREAARIHADAAAQYIGTLSCPAAQKQALIRGIMGIVRQKEPSVPD